MGESQKWMMLFLYSILQFLGGSIWITFASISDRADSYYSTHSAVINLFSLSFLILQFPMAPISSYLFRRSYYWTIHFAYIVSVLGVWVRVIAEKNVGIALFGQVLVGAMNSLTLPGCAVLTNLWFEAKLQPLAVAVASTSNLLGAAFGLVISPYYPNIFDLLIIQASYTSLAGILNLIFSRNRTVANGNNVMEFKSQVKMFFKDFYLLGLIFLISSALGVAYAITGILYQLLKTDGISEVQAGWIGFSMYIGGIFGGLITSALVLFTHNFVNPIRVFTFLSVAGLLLWVVLGGHFLSNLIGSAACGLGLFGLMPLGIQAIVDQNKYISESITTNTIYFIAQGMSVIYTYPLVYFYAISSISGLWLALIFTGLALIPLVFIYRDKFIDKNKEDSKSVFDSLNSINRST